MRKLLPILLLLVACNDVDIKNVKNGNGVATVTFNGWEHVKALGPLAPALQATDLTAQPASVTISWAAFGAVGGTIDGYNVYRRVPSGAKTYLSPLATGVSTLSYTDSTVTAGDTYYYYVAAVSAGQVAIPPSTVDSEIKVIVPRDNMVLIHRWAANKQTCEDMGKSYDRANEYRCTVATGVNAPPATGGSGYMDVGRSYFMDRYEQGCAYTATNACTDATVNGGAAGPCIGVRAPPDTTTVAAAAGSIYYSRRNATCYIRTAGAWTAANLTSSANRQVMGSAAPGLPPFVVLTPTNAHQVCTGQTVTSFGTKRLMRRKDQIIASAWDSSFSDTTIDAIENGSNLDSTRYCNSNYASPQGNSTTDISGTNPTMAYSNSSTPAALDTLPGCRNGDCATTGATIRSVRTGSHAAASCVSRYGAQDLVGNVGECVSDQIACNSVVCAGVTAAANTVDTTNEDFTGVTFDGIQGPAGNFTSVVFDPYGKIQFPLGIPIAGAGFAGDGVAEKSAAFFHGDTFSYRTDATATNQLTVGGSWYFSTGSGRYYLYGRNATTVTGTNAGFRCVVAAD